MRHAKPIRLGLLIIAAAILTLALCAVPRVAVYASEIKDDYQFLYDEAMRYFEMGKENFQRNNMEDALYYFDFSLGRFLTIEGYLDSNDWIIEVNDWIIQINIFLNPPAVVTPSPHTIENLECYETTSTRLLLSWEDSEPGTYTVSWNPARTKTEPKTITTSQMGATLEGLVPGTRYTVQVAPSNGTPLSGSFETKLAPAYTDYGFLPMDLLGNWLNQYKQSVAATFGFHNMLENYDQLKESDGLTSLQGLVWVPPAAPGTANPLRDQDVGFAVSHSFMLTGAPERLTLTRRAVLRVPGVGVFEDTEDVLLVRSSLYTVHIDLTDMLEAAFAAMGGWDRQEMTVELYFDGCLAFSDAITLSVGQQATMPKVTPMLVVASNVQWTYTLTGNEATITGYEGEAPSGDLLIPSEVDGYKVTGIGDSAFAQCYGLTSVTIPAGVTSIGEFAFSSCTNIRSVTIPSSVTDIGMNAFGWCFNLTSVTFQDGLQKIGKGMFLYCRSLVHVTIPDSVDEIGMYAFEKCSSLVDVTIPDGVRRIKGSTFEECSSLVSVTIPDSVEGIDACAFSGCGSLANVTIPAGVTSIFSNTYDLGAFKDCPGLTLTVTPGSHAEAYAKNEGIPYKYK